MENCILVYWKNPITRQRYYVGKITKAQDYTFSYVNNLKEIVSQGFKPFFPFLNESIEYHSTELFCAFSSRLPDKKRNDIKSILLKYNLKEYDAFELLKRSGGRLPIDTLEFIDPINLSLKKEEREFFVAGVSHGDFCDGCSCERIEKIKKGDELELIAEPENEYDPYAIKINFNNIKLGYIPIYFSQAVSIAIKDKRNIECYVVDIKVLQNQMTVEKYNCQECVKAKIIIS